MSVKGELKGFSWVSIALSSKSPTSKMAYFAVAWSESLQDVKPVLPKVTWIGDQGCVLIWVWYVSLPKAYALSIAPGRVNGKQMGWRDGGTK